MSNEKLETALADAVHKATDTAGRAEEFFLAQAPQLAEQILAWGTLHHGLKVGTCLLILVATLGLYTFLWYLVRDEKEDNRQSARLIGAFFALLAGIPSLTIGAQELSSLLKVWVAPKLYLVEYAMEVVR